MPEGPEDPATLPDYGHFPLAPSSSVWGERCVPMGPRGCFWTSPSHPLSPNFFFFCTCPEVTSTVPFPGTCHLAASFPSFLADFTVSVFLPSLCPYPADPSVPVYTQHLPSWALDVCSLPTSPFRLPAHHHLDLLHLKGRSDSSCHISP